MTNARSRLPVKQYGKDQTISRDWPLALLFDSFRSLSLASWMQQIQVWSLRTYALVGRTWLFGCLCFTSSGLREAVLGFSQFQDLEPNQVRLSAVVTQSTFSSVSRTSFIAQHPDPVQTDVEQSHRNSRIYYNRPGNVMRKDTKGHLFWCQEACSVSCALDSVSHLAAIATNLVAANPRECRPCCPANFFLGSAYGTPSPPPHAPACVLRLTGHGLRCLQRFYDKQSLHSMVLQSQVAWHCKPTFPW